MGDDDDGALFIRKLILDSLLDQPVGLEVDAGSGLIQNQNFRLSQNRPGQRNELTFSKRKI
jgi:hypothetical protein